MPLMELNMVMCYSPFHGIQTQYTNLYIRLAEVRIEGLEEKKIGVNG